MDGDGKIVREDENDGYDINCINRVNNEDCGNDANY